jgi:pyruvate/2-oxoglutarate dehydrogenase complex dihydrolipoamide acyltransferase (E2) component
MPNLDLTITEAKIVRWVKGAGERVEAGQAIVEVETDKAVVEVESPATGCVVEILAQEGDVVKLGQRIAIIQTAQGGET